MKPKPMLCFGPILAAAIMLVSCSTPKDRSAGNGKSTANDMMQVPTWSREDLDFFLHGSMSTEVVPEAVLRAFIRTYPDLFPSADLSHLGLIPDPAFGWPVGFSRGPVPHLAGLPALGINCAACHCAEIQASGAPSVRVLGVTSHFDAEGYFGAVAVATFRTADPSNMQRFLAAWLALNDPAGGEPAQSSFASEWKKQEQKITAALAADPSGAKDASPAAFQEIASSELRLTRQSLEAGADLAALSHSMLKLFHNMRASLHIPDQPPEKLPPASGPGRNDAFGLLSAVLFGAPQPYAPVKYGLSMPAAPAIPTRATISALAFPRRKSRNCSNI